MFKSLLLPWKHTKTKVMVPEQMMEDEQILQEQKLSPCTTCGRTFLPHALKKHAPICEKNAVKKRKVFDSLKQRVEGTDLAQFHQKSYLKRQDSTPKTADKVKRTSTWEENHQKLVDAIRTAKGASREMSSNKKPQPLSSSNERCPFCDRQFGHKAFDRHVEWCKEHRTRIQKSPANVLLAKERLEARIKYKVPPLNKSKRSVVKEKYSSPAINRTESVCSVKSTPSSKTPVKTPGVKKPRSVLDLGAKEANKAKEAPVKSLPPKRFYPRSKINAANNESIMVSPVKLVGFPGKKMVTWRDLSGKQETKTDDDPIIVVYENAKYGKKDSTIRNEKFIKDIKEILSDSDDGFTEKSSSTLCVEDSEANSLSDKLSYLQIKSEYSSSDFDLKVESTESGKYSLSDESLMHVKQLRGSHKVCRDTSLDSLEEENFVPKLIRKQIKSCPDIKEIGNKKIGETEQDKSEDFNKAEIAFSDAEDTDKHKSIEDFTFSEQNIKQSFSFRNDIDIKQKEIVFSDNENFNSDNLDMEQNFFMNKIGREQKEEMIFAEDENFNFKYPQDYNAENKTSINKNEEKLHSKTGMQQKEEIDNSYDENVYLRIFNREKSFSVNKNEEDLESGSGGQQEEEMISIDVPSEGYNAETKNSIDTNEKCLHPKSGMDQKEEINFSHDDVCFRIFNRNKSFTVSKEEDPQSRGVQEELKEEIIFSDDKNFKNLSQEYNKNEECLHSKSGVKQKEEIDLSYDENIYLRIFNRNKSFTVNKDEDDPQSRDEHEEQKEEIIFSDEENSNSINCKNPYQDSKEENLHSRSRIKKIVETNLKDTEDFTLNNFDKNKNEDNFESEKEEERVLWDDENFNWKSSYKDVINTNDNVINQNEEIDFSDDENFNQIAIHKKEENIQSVIDDLCSKSDLLPCIQNVERNFLVSQETETKKEKVFLDSDNLDSNISAEDLNMYKQYEKCQYSENLFNEDEIFRESEYKGDHENEDMSSYFYSNYKKCDLFDNEDEESKPKSEDNIIDNFTPSHSTSSISSTELKKILLSEETPDSHTKSAVCSSSFEDTRGDFCFGKENSAMIHEYEVPKKRRKLNSTFIIESDASVAKIKLPKISHKEESPQNLEPDRTSKKQSVFEARFRKPTKKLQIKKDLSSAFLNYRSNNTPYDPFVSAERQFMELLECDDFKTPTQHSNRPQTTKPTAKTNSKKSIKSADPLTNKKRASVIDPPASFQDPEDEFEMLENLINDHFNDENDFFLNKQNKEILNAINERKYSDDMSSIDSNLINENDNLSIPEHFKLNYSSTEDTDTTLQNDDDFYSVQYDKKIESKSKSSDKSHKTKTKLDSSFGSGAGSKKTSPTTKTKKNQNKVVETDMNLSVKPEELFAVDDKMYAEYKIYEEMYLKEKEHKAQSKKQKGKISLKSFGIEINNDDNTHQTNKVSDDSAYGSLNRNSPKPKTAKLSPLQRKRIDSASSSGSEIYPTSPEVNQRMSKFCHECGNKYPLSTAKFCVECGVRRLVL